MKYFITIDGGTTNTEITVWDEKKQVTISRKYPVGVRMTAISKDPAAFVKKLQDCVKQILEECSVGWNMVEGAAASGMITSGLGIREIPHIPSPAGIDELAKAAVWINDEELFPVPVLMIPGVCCRMEGLADFDDRISDVCRRMEGLAGSDDRISDVCCRMEGLVGSDDRLSDVRCRMEGLEGLDYRFADMMRGEETETIAILKTMQLEEETVIFLPGSHDKLIFTDQNQKIVDSCTSITGELLRALMQDTILAESVGEGFLSVEELEEDWLLCGYEDARIKGLGSACFLTRILQTKGIATRRQAASYLLGIVLENDVKMLQCHPSWNTAGKSARQILIYGNSSACHGLYLILSKEFPGQKLQRIEMPEKSTYAAYGARIIWERAKEISERHC